MLCQLSVVATYCSFLFPEKPQGNPRPDPAKQKDPANYEPNQAQQIIVSAAKRQDKDNNPSSRRVPQQYDKQQHAYGNL
jgi:hypothetical protein